MWINRCKGFDCRHTWATACLSLIELYGPVSFSVKQGLDKCYGDRRVSVSVNHRPVYLRDLKTWFESLGLLESL